MNDHLLARLKFGAPAWNQWRRENPHVAISLDGAKSDGMILTGIDFSRASLRGTSLHATNLMNADLRYADLTGTNLREADLIASNLEGAILHGASLHEADFLGANLTNAPIRGRGPDRGAPCRATRRLTSCGCRQTGMDRMS